MTVTFRAGEVGGTVRPPSSKSQTHRAVFLSALSTGVSEIRDALICDDVLSTVEACRSIGAEITVEGSTIRVRGGGLHAPEGVVDVGNSGTTLRIFAGICAMFDSECTITGDASLRRRPMGPLLDALTSMGAECSSDGGRAPVRIKGPVRGGKVRIDGSGSSQFITSLLILSEMLDQDTCITVDGGMVSSPYIDMTSHMMEHYGATILWVGDEFYVKGGWGYRPADYRVSSDYSSAAFAMAAGALGGEVTVTGMVPGSPQGDMGILNILRKAGASVSVNGDRITVGRGVLKGCDINMSDTPDLFPVVAVLMSTAEGDSRLYGAPHLRLKESDRIASTVDMLNSLGGRAEATEDGCIVHGVPRLRGGRVDHRGDHRMMMSAAVASAVCDGGVEMDDAECCSVSYPGFVRDMESIGIHAEARRCSRPE